MRLRTVLSIDPIGSATRWVSQRDSLPLSLRAVLRFHSRTGRFDFTSLRLRRWVDDTLEEVLSETFGAIAGELERELGYEGIEFEYETKLTLPVELTLGYLYRKALSKCEEDINPITEDVKTLLMESFRIPSDTEHKRRRRERMRRREPEAFAFLEKSEKMARLCTEALLDGDMRDAINDDEYEDFTVNVPLDDKERVQVAKIAQSYLCDRVDAQLAEFPEAVTEAYQAAVDESSTHQADDNHFRDLMIRALTDSDEEAVRAIKNEYKYAPFNQELELLTEKEQNWPYCKTQYERVGVIYDGMIEMFRAADIAIEDEFKHAIVLSIIGAQIWLDDIDDFAADRAENQLTPVTAEYIIADSEQQAYENVLAISSRYLDQAIQSAVKSESNLTGIAAEYIYLSGTREKLPGHSKTQ